MKVYYELDATICDDLFTHGYTVEADVACGAIVQNCLPTDSHQSNTLYSNMFERSLNTALVV